MNVTTFGSRKTPPDRQVYLTPADVETAIRRYIIEERPELTLEKKPFDLSPSVETAAALINFRAIFIARQTEFEPLTR